MKKQKYILTRKLHAKEPMVPGDAIELTADQAAMPMYRNRVRLAGGAEIEVEASPEGEKGEPPAPARGGEKKAEKGIELKLPPVRP